MIELLVWFPPFCHTEGSNLLPLGSPRWDPSQGTIQLPLFPYKLAQDRVIVTPFRVRDLHLNAPLAPLQIPTAERFYRAINRFQR